jgi:hypothetical protein
MLDKLILNMQGKYSEIQTSISLQRDISVKIIRIL